MADHEHSLGHHPAHAWPVTTSGWEALNGCLRCGLVLLRQFLTMPEWVVRRVEGIEFVDDRTVRRRVSVDYVVPPEAVQLRLGDGSAARVLPLAMMRRKSLINFDFRDHDGQPLPLLGLRENQALTLGVVRAWAAAILEEHRVAVERWPDELPGRLDEVLHDVVAGDQQRLARGYGDISAALHEVTGTTDKRFAAVLERLGGTFILFGTERAPYGSRRVVKWSYDEPLTLVHRTTAYQGHADGPLPPPAATAAVTYGVNGIPQRWWAPDPLLAGLGVHPTLVRFPTPGAELAASFHVEVTAPPEVAITTASLLAGRPNMRRADRPGERRVPSFDSVSGGYPTVDLHVAEVPYGSLSRAQVELQASPNGWLATAALATLVATLMLLAAAFGQPEKPDLPTLVLISYAAAMVAVVVRPDPHAMLTRLLSSLRVLAGFSAALVLAGAVAYTFLGVEGAAPWLLGLTLLSLGPAGVLLWAWWLARRRLVRDRLPRRDPARRPGEVPRCYERPTRGRPDPTSWRAAMRRLRAELTRQPLIRLSPWEQHTTLRSLQDGNVDADFRIHLATDLAEAGYPYDEAVVLLEFDRPAIKIASAESDRLHFEWSTEFMEQTLEVLDRELGHRPAGV